MRVTHITAVAVACFLALLVVPASAPVEVSYVHSDSMEPAIPEGSGYVLVPADVQPGDIVTFYAPTRGEYVTHRVVEETPRGFVTKGDNNPDTDQATGLPLVQRSQVVGEVLVVAGEPVTIPALGEFGGWIQAYWPVLVGGAAAYAVLGGQGSASSRRPERGPVTQRDVVWPVVGGVVVLAVAFTVMSASHATTSYLATSGGIGGANTIPVGETVTRNYSITVTHSPLTRTVVTVDGAAVRGRTTTATTRWLYGLATHSSVNVTLGVDAPAQPGAKRASLSVYAYPRTLPAGVTRSLTRVHPVVASAATAVAGLAPLLGAYWVYGEASRPVRLPRSKRVRRYFEGEP